MGRRKQLARTSEPVSGSKRPAKEAALSSPRGKVLRTTVAMATYVPGLLPTHPQRRGPFRVLTETALDLWYGKLVALDGMCMRGGCSPPYMYAWSRAAAVKTMIYYSEQRVWTDHDEDYLTAPDVCPIRGVAACQPIFALRSSEDQGAGAPKGTFGSQSLYLIEESFRRANIDPGSAVNVSIAHYSYLRDKYERGEIVTVVGYIFASQENPTYIRLAASSAPFFQMEVRKFHRVSSSYSGLVRLIRSEQIPGTELCDVSLLSGGDSPIAVFGVTPDSRPPICGSYMVAECSQTGVARKKRPLLAMPHPITGEPVVTKPPFPAADCSPIAVSGEADLFPGGSS